MYNKVKQLIILSGDLILLPLSLYLTLVARYLKIPEYSLWLSHITSFYIVFFIWLLFLYIHNLYSLKTLSNNYLLVRKSLQSSFWSGLISIVFFYSNTKINIAPKINLLIFIIIFSSLSILWRKLIAVILKSYVSKTNIAILGLSKLTEQFISEVREKNSLGYEISFVLDTKDYSKNYLLGVPIFHNADDLIKLLDKYRIGLILSSSKEAVSDKITKALFDYLPAKVSYAKLSDFYEQISGKVPLDDISQMWFIEKLNEQEKAIFDKTKRLLDIFLSAIILITSWPLWIVFGIAMKIDSPGSILFKQLRSGKGNNNFYIYKLRTMRTTDNDQTPLKLNDSRVGLIGSFLRKTRIDELPQAINILKGEMSLIGPRPERPEIIKILEKDIPFYKERMLVKPGVTGWDQISGEYHSPSKEDTLKKLQYDLFYIKNRSVYLDFSIILKTIATVLSREGR